MKYQDVLKRFVSQQAQLLQEKQMEQQLKEQMLAAKAQALGSFIPGQMQSPQEEYSETEHNPFEEGQEYKAGGIHIDPSKKGTFKAQATRMGMSIQEAASHILNNKEKYSSAMVKKANFAKNFAKEEGGIYTGDYMYEDGGEMIRRADGSYSQRGLWDNIRANRGSGKKPTKEMLEQERRINNKYPDGGPIRSMIENTSGPRAEEVDVPMDYQSFIKSDVYEPDQKEKIYKTWSVGDEERTLKGTFYRKDGDKMSIDRIKALYPDGTTKEEPYDYLNGMHRMFQNELLYTSANDYDNYKDFFLKHEIKGDIPNYVDTEDIVKKAYEHNLKNNYDDTDMITSYLNEQAKKQGLGKYDYMKKFYNGYSDAAIARQLLEDYKKKVKK